MKSTLPMRAIYYMNPSAEGRATDNNEIHTRKANYISHNIKVPGRGGRDVASPGVFMGMSRRGAVYLTLRMEMWYNEDVK